MTRFLVFLFCTGILAAVIAALLGSHGVYLLNGAVVWLITVWVVAVCATEPTTKGPHK